MQCAYLADHPGVQVAQPSTLNLIKLNDSPTTPDKTDHPSIQSSIFLDSPVLGKAKKSSSRRKILNDDAVVANDTDKCEESSCLRP